MRAKSSKQRCPALCNYDVLLQFYTPRKWTLPSLTDSLAPRPNYNIFQEEAISP